MTTKTTVAPGSSFTVPAGITALDVEAWGAAGEAKGSGSPGRGGKVRSRLTVSPSDVLAVARVPGGAGGSAGGQSGGKGGDGCAVGSLVVAPGGGGTSGMGYNSIPTLSGGDGGLAVGVDGQGLPADFIWADPGKGASGSSGGAGGSLSTATYAGYSAGAAGQDAASGGAGGAGGNAQGGTGYGHSGGGGGGGYAGGGGGTGGRSDSLAGGPWPGGGGGGGSSLADEWVGFNATATVQAIFTHAGAPKAPTALGPVGNVYVDRTAPITLSFQHNPDTPGDSLDVQTDAQVRGRPYNVGAEWTVFTNLGTDTAVSIAANTLAVGQYEWQAQTKADGTAGDDATGIWGPWSTSEYFQAATPPATPTISSPASGATIAVATVSPVWSAPGQVEYQARLTGDNAGVADESVIYSDTGTKSGAATTATLAAMTNHVSAHVQVRIRTTVGGLWSAWADVPVTIEWAGPPKPRVTLATDMSSIFVTVTNPPPVGVEPVADRIEVYVHENGVRERRAILAPGAGWIYETPPSGVEVGIEAVAIYTPTNVQTSSGVIW